MMSTPYKPAGYHTVTSYLVVPSADDALKYYATAFGAVEVMRLTMPDGSIGHAEMTIGDSHVMLSDENPEWGNRTPASLGGTPVGLMIYVEDCDAVFAKAVEAGATPVMPIADQFYGDRSGTVLDPYGHKWTIATHKETLSPEVMKERMDAWMAEMSHAG
jgi:PhnB protein